MENDNWTQEFKNVDFISNMPSFVFGSAVFLIFLSILYFISSPFHFIKNAILLFLVYLVGRVVKWAWVKAIKK